MPISAQNLSDDDNASIPRELPVKKQRATDLLTIFSDTCMVKFCHPDGKVESLKGRWCKVCK